MFNIKKNEISSIDVISFFIYHYNKNFYFLTNYLAKTLSCKIEYRQEWNCIIGFDNDIPMINISEGAIITVNGKTYEGT